MQSTTIHMSDSQSLVLDGHIPVRMLVCSQRYHQHDKTHMWHDCLDVLVVCCWMQPMGREWVNGPLDHMLALWQRSLILCRETRHCGSLFITLSKVIFHFSGFLIKNFFHAVLSNMYPLNSNRYRTLKGVHYPSRPSYVFTCFQ